MTGAGKREKEQWTERERDGRALGRKMERETERESERERSTWSHRSTKRNRWLTRLAVNFIYVSNRSL